jgi:hypothetical protein
MSFCRLFLKFLAKIILGILKRTAFCEKLIECFLRIEKINECFCYMNLLLIILLSKLFNNSCEKQELDFLKVIFAKERIDEAKVNVTMVVLAYQSADESGH